MLKLRKPSEIGLTHADLLQLVTYDPGTGVFNWRERPKFRRKNRALGCNDRGYIVIGIQGGHYLAHRLAWFYVTGEWPKHFIDHKDGDPSNNAYANLREATQSQNIANARKLKRGGTSKFKGVYWIKADRKWSAQIRVAGKLILLGRFNDEQAAHEAYMAAARKHFGDFARAA